MMIDSLRVGNGVSTCVLSQAIMLVTTRMSASCVMWVGVYGPLHTVRSMVNDVAALRLEYRRHLDSVQRTSKPSIYLYPVNGKQSPIKIKREISELFLLCILHHDHLFAQNAVIIHAD